MKMTLNQLLVQMDGFEENNGVIVIGATNFPDSLDAGMYAFIILILKQLIIVVSYICIYFYIYFYFSTSSSWSIR